MVKFIDRWKEKEKQPSIVSKIKDMGKQQTPLKDQINQVVQRLDTQTQTLDAAVQRFQNRDADIFNRVVKALANREEARANILATELSEIRKVEKMLMHASLALQSVSMRLNTVSEMGDVVAVLSPAKGVLSSIGSEMINIFPEASQELGNIGNLLTDIVCTTHQSADININNPIANEETEAILREAEFAVEKKLKQQLPEITTQNAEEHRTSIEA